jgi:hypothetical protein
MRKQEICIALAYDLLKFLRLNIRTFLNTKWHQIYPHYILVQYINGLAQKLNKSGPVITSGIK